jgi:hypothetical protein
MTLPTFISVIYFAASRAVAVDGRDVNSFVINGFKDISLTSFQNFLYILNIPYMEIMSIFFIVALVLINCPIVKLNFQSLR